MYNLLTLFFSYGFKGNIQAVANLVPGKTKVYFITIFYYRFDVDKLWKNDIENVENNTMLAR